MELEPEVLVLGSNLQVLGSDQAMLRALAWSPVGVAQWFSVDL